MQKVRPLFILAMLASLVITGCQKESTTTPSSDARVAFIGNWSVQESWVKLSYEARIASDTNSKTGVLIYNFADSEIAYLCKWHTLTSPSQFMSMLSSLMSLCRMDLECM